MKLTFQCGLSKIEDTLQKQTVVIKELSDKVDHLWGLSRRVSSSGYSHDESSNSSSSSGSGSINTNSVGVGNRSNYGHTKLNQNSPSRQYVGHVQENKGRINVSLSRK